VPKTIRVPEWQVNQAILVNIARMPKAACSRAKKMHAAAANGPSATSISSVQRLQASRQLAACRDKHWRDVYSKEIKFTDFPLDEITPYLSDGPPASCPVSVR
jgi:hypothetical protein